MDAIILPFDRARQTTEPSCLADPSHFDEQQFRPYEGTSKSYLAAVSRGYEAMKSHRVVIAGLARDIDVVLPKTIARIERLGSLFRDYRVVLYENDSADRTRELLHSWSDMNPRITVICEKRDDPVNHPSRCLSRASRMAYYRAQCHQVIAREHARFDSVILVDTDMEGGWSYDGVANTFGQDGWDFVGANGIIYRRRWLSPNTLVHYDAWAFRLDRQMTPLTTKQVNRSVSYRGQPMQRVTSCFGGLGVYRMPAYLAGQYDGSDVEHVTFHREIIRRGFTKLYLNPSLITVYGRKHRSLDPMTARLMRAMDAIRFKRHEPWQYAATAPLSRKKSVDRAA